MNKKTGSSVYLLITKGPHKGEKFSLSKKTIIGRSESANISLIKDNRISRQHAIILFQNNNFYIKNLSKNNKLYINKKEIKETKIKITDTISAGTSQFQIMVKEAKNDLSSSYSYKSNKTSNKKIKKKSAINPVRIILVLLLITGAYFYTEKSKKPRLNDRNIASEDVIENKETKKNERDKRKKLIEEIKNNKKKNNVLAQSEYVIGFRDFKKGQYARAIIHLTNCLNYQPDHLLCNRYLGLSQKKVDEIIQYQAITGRKFLDQKQYKACTSSFRNIAFLVQNKEDPRYKEAIENEKFCKQMLEGSF